MLPLALMLAASSPTQVPPVVTITATKYPDCLQNCPPPNDPAAPFLRLPKFTDVEECRGGDATEACGGKTWSHTFHTAARFTLPRYGLNQEPLEGDAFVIYEGMKLTVNETNGVYDLSFTATVPTRPVTVRLQLLFRDSPVARPIRLTLPPMRLENDESTASGDNSGRTVRIQHRGFSELFLHPLMQGPSNDLLRKLPVFAGFGMPPPPVESGCFQITKEWEIQRAGTAHFGSARINSDEDDR